MRIVLLLIAGLLGASPALAQISDDYIDAINHAIFIAEDGDLAAGYDAATGLLDIADTDEERLRAYDLAMNIAMAAGRWLDAENQAFAGAQLVREELGGQPDLLRPFLERQAEAARQQGAMDRHQRLEAEIRSLSAGRLALIWNEDRRGFRHRLSGFQCPREIDGLPFALRHSNELAGTDSYCLYRAAAGSGPEISIYVRYLPEASGAFMDRIPVAARAGLSAEQPLSWGDHSVLFRQGVIDGVSIHLWQALQFDWEFTLMGTGLSDAAAATVLAEAFASMDDSAEHLQDCAGLSGRRQLRDAYDRTGFANTAFIASMMPHQIGGFGPDDRRLDCLIAHRPDSYQVAYAEVDRSGEPTRYVWRTAFGDANFIAATAQPDIRNIERNLTGRRSSGVPFVLALHQPDQVRIFGLFNGPPSPDAFLEHVQLIESGELPHISGARIDEDGDTVIDASQLFED